MGRAGWVSDNARRIVLGKAMTNEELAAKLAETDHLLERVLKELQAIKVQLISQANVARLEGGRR